MPKGPTTTSPNSDGTTGAIHRTEPRTNAMRLQTTSTNPEQTHAIGLALGRVLGAGEVVALQGELGAGKTTLVRAIVEGLGGQPDSVSSPTFTIAQEYPTPRAVVVHIDAYRLDPDADDLGEVGFDRLTDGSGLVLIEWPERLEGRVPFDATLTLTHTGETSRELVLDLPDSWRTRAHFEALTELLGEPIRDTTCPVTGKAVPADSPTWPFADERARMADLYGWFSGTYTVSRPMEQRDLEEE